MKIIKYIVAFAAAFAVILIFNYFTEKTLDYSNAAIGAILAVIGLYVGLKMQNSREKNSRNNS